MTQPRTYFVLVQGLENYDLYEAGAQSTYWKHKSGTDIIVSNAMSVPHALSMVMRQCLVNDAFIEYPTKATEVPNDYQTNYELYQLEEAGKIEFPCKRIDANAKQEG